MQLSLFFGRYFKFFGRTSGPAPMFAINFLGSHIDIVLKVNTLLINRIEQFDIHPILTIKVGPRASFSAISRHPVRNIVICAPLSDSNDLFYM